MSACICVMNKNAIALAADSAVTVGNHLAIHNSANKLFSLSKSAPIGVIIYADAYFMGVPMENIIKGYKKELDSRSFNTLKEHIEDFISFLEENSDFFKFDDSEHTYIEQVYSDLMRGMLGDYNQLLKRKTDEVKRPLCSAENLRIQEEACNITLSFIDSQPHLQQDDVFAPYVRDTYLTKIKNDIIKSFALLPDDKVNTLSMKICELFDRKFFRNSYVGIAFAGFGEKEIFPSMVHFKFGGIINKHLRYSELGFSEINNRNLAAITPFAQTDVMQTFLYGINDSFLQTLGQEIPNKIIGEFRANNISVTSPDTSVNPSDVINKITNKVIEGMISKVQRDYLSPIVQSISTLPIEELASLAESMITITSLRRKVVYDDNIGTVGGPIDVAIISKYDGFIWMKRKHYFDASYNPQFFYTHYSK